MKIEKFSLVDAVLSGVKLFFNNLTLFIPAILIGLFIKAGFVFLLAEIYGPLRFFIKFLIGYNFGEQSLVDNLGLFVVMSIIHYVVDLLLIKVALNAAKSAKNSVENLFSIFKYTIDFLGVLLIYTIVREWIGNLLRLIPIILKKSSIIPVNFVYGIELFTIIIAACFMLFFAMYAFLMVIVIADRGMSFFQASDFVRSLIIGNKMKLSILTLLLILFSNMSGFMRFIPELSFFSEVIIGYSLNLLTIVLSMCIYVSTYRKLAKIKQIN